MSRTADLIGYSEDGNIQLVVEVKKTRDVSHQWVEQFRRNLLMHSVIPASKFFLFVLPRHAYLWKNGTVTESDRGPDYTLLTRDILRPYVSELNIDEISEQGLELLVRSWLSDLINSDLKPQSATREQSWLFDSGLYESIKNGSIRAEVHV